MLIGGKTVFYFFFASGLYFSLSGNYKHNACRKLVTLLEITLSDPQAGLKSM